MTNSPRIIISGGGTGGHIFPAVAIANEVRRRLPAAEILFVGATGRMEMTRVPEAGYQRLSAWTLPACSAASHHKTCCFR